MKLARKRDLFTVLDRFPDCDVCARKGIRVEARWDSQALMSRGSWAYFCEACFYRLPAEVKRMAHKIVVVE
jgi:hypothetical protein